MGNNSNNEINELANQILRAEDYEESSRLLIILGEKDQLRAGQVALALLNKSIGDKYLRGFAFEMLYTYARPVAIQYIAENAISADLHILEAMLSAVTEDSGADDGKDEVLQAVRQLRQVIALRSPTEIAEIADTVDWFNSSFEGW